MHGHDSMSCLKEPCDGVSIESRQAQDRAKEARSYITTETLGEIVWFTGMYRECTTNAPKFE